MSLSGRFGKQTGSDFRNGRKYFLATSRHLNPNSDSRQFVFFLGSTVMANPLWMLLLKCVLIFNFLGTPEQLKHVSSV